MRWSRGRLERVQRGPRALGRDGFAETDFVTAGDERGDGLPPLLERPLTKAIAIEAQQIEGDQRWAAPYCHAKLAQKDVNVTQTFDVADRIIARWKENLSMRALPAAALAS
jgi:hypothetical protein